MMDRMAANCSALIRRLIVCALAVVLGGLPSAAQPRRSDSSSKVRVSAVAAAAQVTPGGDVPVAIIFDHEPGWHIHTNDPQVPPELGEAEYYIKTEIEIDETDAGSLRARLDHIQWPEPETIDVAFLGVPVRYAVFSGKAIAYLPVTVPEDAPLGVTKLDIRVTYQACDDTVCLFPVRGQTLNLEVEIVDADHLPKKAMTVNSAIFAGFPIEVWQRIRGGISPAETVAFDLFGASFDLDVSRGLGIALLLAVAMIGGLLLNLTPCVLPVIPIKIMALSQSAGNRLRCFQLGAVMTIGVIVFWLGLGIIVASIAGFSATNQLFQYPAFIIGVGIFIAVMAVGMCGFFFFQPPQFVYAINPNHETYFGSFIFGIMTAILSTPCTAPFMGAALGWATKQAPTISLSTFASIGFGMALPYLVLSAWPGLLQWMPRAGPASELIKQVMGLLMLAAAAYFIGVGVSGLSVDPPDPPSIQYWWAVVSFVVSAGAWLSWRTFQITPSRTNRFLFVGLGVLVVLGSVAGGVRLTDEGPIDWDYYTPERFQQALADGKVVVLKFTAEWCLNCKALEQSVFRDPAVVALFGQGHVIPMKVDLTGNNELGNQKLSEVGRLTIPLLVVFAPDGTETFKGDFYTVQQVQDAIVAAQALVFSNPHGPDQRVYFRY